ncbi:hypothetical protein J2T57_002941 [Natronocella acetinitrilica]|uniref:Gluconate 2-dehydrogenase subunit 3 family protein n=1 Tax=Natronocella acetinitrilica TaxID=414046 RepID=A0AAE3KCH8_9GAMM|nr:hypothetical protein [Natronocella acetinitrilica]MCP1675786.1 hypothetical protein [Natronocella acetinitrilica]
MPTPYSRRRRRILLGLGVTAVAMTAGGQALLSRRNVLIERYARPAYDQYLGFAPEQRSGPLAGEAVSEVQALAEVIYPPAGAEEQQELQRVVSQWMRARTELDGQLPLYQQGARLLTGMARQSANSDTFAALDQSTRIALLASLEPPETDSPNSLRSHWFRFRRRESRFYIYGLRDELIDAIFTSRLGWQIVGNTHTWPGAPGDPAAVALPPGA